MRQQSYQFSSPWFRQLGYLTWFVLLIMALIFYKERAIFLDGAFQLEALINEGQFKIYHYRLTNPFTQILALAAIYLGLPLKAVLMAYSVNFILFFGAIYWAIVYWFNNDYLGWVQVFFFTLMVLDSYYFLPPELYQGSALLLLWWAILLDDPQMKKKWTFPVLILFMIPILSDSRLIPTYFFFCFVFFWLSNKKLRHPKYYVLLAVMFLFMYIHGHFFVTGYDTNKMADFNANLEEWFPKYWELPANKLFLEKCLKFYYFYPIILFSVIAGYIISYLKNIDRISYPLLKAFLTIGANLAFLLLLHIGSPRTSYRFYAEVNYLPLTIFICVPFLFDIVSLIKSEKWLLFAFFAIVLIRINTIASNHKQFENRHNWYLSQMDKATEMGSAKSIMHTSQSPKKLLIQPWASSQETLLLSSLEGPEYSRTLAVYSKPMKKYNDLIQSMPDYPGYFFTNFTKLDIEDEMNKTYFGLKEGKYLIRD